MSSGRPNTAYVSQTNMEWWTSVRGSGFSLARVVARLGMGGVRRDLLDTRERVIYQCVRFPSDHGDTSAVSSSPTVFVSRMIAVNAVTSSPRDMCPDMDPCVTHTGRSRRVAL